MGVSRKCALYERTSVPQVELELTHAAAGFDQHTHVSSVFSSLSLQGVVFRFFAQVLVPIL